MHPLNNAIEELQAARANAVAGRDHYDAQIVRIDAALAALQVGQEAAAPKAKRPYNKRVAATPKATKATKAATAKAKPAKAAKAVKATKPATKATKSATKPAKKAADKGDKLPQLDRAFWLDLVPAEGTTRADLLARAYKQLKIAPDSAQGKQLAMRGAFQLTALSQAGLLRREGEGQTGVYFRNEATAVAA